MVETSYLHNLRFDEKLKKSMIFKYLTNLRLVILVVLLVIGAGIYSFLNLPRTLNPDIKIPIVTVVTALPGAGPKDVESLVTIPLEDGVSGIAGVKTVTSNSNNSVSVIQITFNDNVDPDKAQSDTQSAVNNVTTLPKDAQTPKVQKIDFSHQPVWVFSLETNSDTGSLMRYAKELRDKIKRLSSISEVDVPGLDEQEVQIILKPESIATYGLNPQQISGAISTAIKAFPAGSIQTSESSFALTIDQQATTIDDLRNLQISLNGQSVQLSSIADISERSKPNQNASFTASKQSAARQSVTFDVFKTDSVNIDKAYNDTKQLLDSEPAIINGQFHVSSVQNVTDNINTQFEELTRDFIVTILLVFVVLFIFLGIRQALVASFAIPLTFGISFTIMYMTGIAVSFISLFALLLALGLLVDDTIVIASAITAYHRSGKFSPIETGLLVWRDFLLAIFTTTITTVWAFLPLLLSSGIIGEFIKPIPIVMSSTLLASFFVAMFITLPFVIYFLQPQLPRRIKIFLRILIGLVMSFMVLSFLPKGKIFGLELLGLVAFVFIAYQVRFLFGEWGKKLAAWIQTRITLPDNFSERMDDGLIHFTVISNKYHAIIENILKSKKNRVTAIIIAIAFAVFAYFLVPLGLVHNEFFPKSNSDYIFMTLTLPPGTNNQTATKYAKQILAEVKNTPATEFVTADVGQSFNSGGGATTAAGDSNSVLFSFVLIPHQQRSIASADIADGLRKQFASFSAGKISVQEESGGPPAGSDIQIKLLGDDLTVLNHYADKVEQFLAKTPGTVNIDKSIKPGTSKLVFVPDQAKVADAGVTTDQLGFWMRLFASGFSTDSVKFDSQMTDKEDITVRLQPFSENPEAFNTITIPVQKNGVTNNVNLASLGNLRMETNPTTITREGGQRTISVTADLAKGYNSTVINQKLLAYAKSDLQLPSGYSWKTGGVNEENNNSVTSILLAMILSFALIMITMVLQFSSFRRALIVMLVIPLSISGVFIIFGLTNTPLSFPALIGLLALFGIVVKNSILVVDKIVQNQKMGIAFIPAIADAASSRLEAIALTSVATIIGLIPISLSDPTWRGLGGAIIAGLLFSGTIMLFVIPVVYYYWFREKKQN